MQSPCALDSEEEARLQSFPDGFRFEGSMNPAFTQIGNAVPPLLSWALAESIFECLKVRMSPTQRYSEQIKMIDDERYCELPELTAMPPSRERCATR